MKIQTAATILLIKHSSNFNFWHLLYLNLNILAAHFPTHYLVDYRRKRANADPQMYVRCPRCVLLLMKRFVISTRFFKNIYISGKWLCLFPNKTMIFKNSFRKCLLTEIQQFYDCSKYFLTSTNTINATASKHHMKPAQT